ncbi:hypothetical protein DSO57_1022962 [Entomophthora muscae]|uniref:Uncharacterized protein n=1 Tax=Entomophthora muscae TaxID=34485 RepID=A0ACC2RU59_9FUNG|nr:hypothetical protein DSO57_1022962 [Entomophthora muscae]
MDPYASPECFLPDKEEVNKDLLHQVLAVNAVTRRQAIRTKALPSLLTTLETLKSLKPELTSALEAFLALFKGLDVHKVTKIESPDYGDQHGCTYIKLVVHKLRVQEISDSGAPRNIVSTSVTAHTRV